jgi:V/A-type H+-transporting ATPase subunit K
LEKKLKKDCETKKLKKPANKTTLRGRHENLKRRLIVLIAIAQVFFALAASSVIAFATSLQPIQEKQTNVEQAVSQTGIGDAAFIALAAGLAMGLSAIASAYAIASSGTAAISALAEKPETFFRSFLVVALAEAISIYGLIIGILLWLKI